MKHQAPAVSSAVLAITSLLAWSNWAWPQNLIATVPLGPTAPIGPGAAQGVAVNQATNKVYVAGLGMPGPSTVTVIDGATDSTTVLQTSECMRDVPAVAVNEATNQIYLACDNGALVVIDGATNSQATLSDPNANLPLALAVDSATDKIYVANSGSNNVTVIDGATDSTTTLTDPNATGPFAVAIDQSTDKIYVLNQANVTVIDGTDNSIATVMVSGARAIAVNAVTNKIYVATGSDISVIDGATNTITTVAVPAVQLAVNSTTNRIYALSTNNNVAVIDGATNSSTMVADPYSPVAVAVSETTNMVYVADAPFTDLSLPPGCITVIDGNTNSTRLIIDPNALQAAGLTVNAATNRIYVLNVSSLNLTVIDGAGIPTAHALAVVLASGPGTQDMTFARSGLTIMSNPAGIDCVTFLSPSAPLPCAASFDIGTMIDLTPSDIPGWTVLFLGEPCTGKSSCSITMSSDQLVTATVFNVVPNVVGLTQTAANDAITGLGLIVGTVTQQSSSTVPSGDVLSTSPPVGTIVAGQSDISLVISTGAAAGGGGPSSGGGGGAADPWLLLGLTGAIRLRRGRTKVGR
jgi:YVTN family beta-propeller protein